MGTLIPQGLAGSPNHSGFLNNLLTLTNCESLKEIGEMAYFTPAWSSTCTYNLVEYIQFFHNGKASCSIVLY